uniref:Secreted protein n=1 Tax=Anopheles dirus TaxID=7168 RepID=A0A182NXK2_9DIPT
MSLGVLLLASTLHTSTGSFRRRSTRLDRLLFRYAGRCHRRLSGDVLLAMDRASAAKNEQCQKYPQVAHFDHCQTPVHGITAHCALITDQ